MQTHVLRKHNGFGTPINLMDNSVQLSTERDVIMDNAYEDHQYQRNKKNISDWRNAKSQDSHTDSVDFMDKTLTTVRKFSEIKELLNRLSPNRNQFSSFGGLLMKPLSSSPLPRVPFPCMSFPLMEDPLIESVIGYRGGVCKICLMKYMVPIYGFQETGKIVEVEHRCYNRVYVGNEILAAGRLPDFVIDLYEEVLEDLRNVVNRWTQNRPYLVSELLPGLSTHTNLTISNKKNNWARRTLMEGRTILRYAELEDFLRSSGNQTFNCFNVHYEQEGYSLGPYMMCISRTPKITISS
jgi:hypothetical protein